MNNKNTSISDIQDEAIMQEKDLDIREVAKKKKEAAAVKKQSIKRWHSEKEKNEEEIERNRKRKEERKREMDEEQALLLSMRKEDEAKAAKEEEEDDKIKIDIDHEEMQQQKPKQNFSDQKKFKTKEVQEYEEALSTFIKPLDVKTMDIVQLNADNERPQVLANVWEEKFNAWMNSAQVDGMDEE